LKKTGQEDKGRKTQRKSKEANKKNSGRPEGMRKTDEICKKGNEGSTNKTFQAVICIRRKRGQNNISGLLSQG